MNVHTLIGLSFADQKIDKWLVPWLLFGLAGMALGEALAVPGDLWGAQDTSAERVVTLEVYFDSSEPSHEALVTATEQFLQARPGVRLRRYDLNAAAADQEAQASAARRLEKIVAAARLSQPPLPLFYGCNTVVPAADEGTVRQHLEAALRIDVYVRAGCSHCAEAKKFIPELQQRYPGFEFRYRDIVVDRTALEALNRLVTRYRRAATSTPVFHLFNQMIVGFDGPTTTGVRLKELMDKWTVPGKAASQTQPAEPEAKDHKQSSSFQLQRTLAPGMFQTMLLALPNRCTFVHYRRWSPHQEYRGADQEAGSAAAAQAELPLPSEIPLP